MRYVWVAGTDAKDYIMASAFSHAFVAVALGTAYARENMPWQFWALSVLCAVLPDADVISFAWGVRYESMWGIVGCRTRAVLLFSSVSSCWDWRGVTAPPARGTGG